MEADGYYERGLAYEGGTMGTPGGVARDESKALDLFKKAAKGGHPLAQIKLASRYASGLGVKRDLKEAGRWYTKAAEQGNADAQYALGVMWGEGQLGKVDKTQSLKWMKMAAQGGNFRALEALQIEASQAAPTSNEQKAEMAPDRPRNYFTVGSTKEEVLKVQGTPDHSSESLFLYGYSSVSFQRGRVTSWSDTDKNLKVRLVPAAAASRDFFTVGSTKDEVVALQGTPNNFSESLFLYGYSSVSFQGGRVTSWSNTDKNLKVRLVPAAAASRDFFTVGSTKDEVVALQGTPDNFSESLFLYGYSSVSFQRGKVVSWSDVGKNLKAR
jgi:outer membrane protein assembly factor BamE (lipoprotein component of BamABCDE complex)